MSTPASEQPFRLKLTLLIIAGDEPQPVGAVPVVSTDDTTGKLFLDLIVQFSIRSEELFPEKHIYTYSQPLWYTKTSRLGGGSGSRNETN